MYESVPQGMAAAVASSIDVEGAEQRGAPRVTMLIRAAKLISDKGEFLCIVRDASESGISVRLFHPLPQLDGATMELPNGDRHRLETVWLEDAKAGFRFVDEVDFVRLIENKGVFSKRAIRVNLQMDARIRFAGSKMDVAIQNISQQGAQIATGARLALDQRLELMGSGLPKIEAKVRWRKDGSYGLVFENTFQLADLARFVARAQITNMG